MFSRQIENVYCDDIRQEIGGKYSLMGVYRGDLFVPEFPFKLEKLCFSIRVFTDVSEPFEFLNIAVLKDDDVMAELTAPEDVLSNMRATSQQQASLLLEHGMERMFTLHFETTVSPLPLDGPCVIRVKAESEAGRLKGAALRVAELPQPEAE